MRRSNENNDGDVSPHQSQSSNQDVENKHTYLLMEMLDGETEAPEFLDTTTSTQNKTLREVS